MVRNSSVVETVVTLTLGPFPEEVVDVVVLLLLDEEDLLTEEEEYTFTGVKVASELGSC